MKIVDAWVQNNDVFAYCIGDGIDAKFSCNKISVNGNVYAVADVDTLVGVSGSKAAILKLKGTNGKELPHGMFQVVS